MRLLVVFFTGFMMLQQASASTFVGNGGNAGDIELQITLGQLQKTLENVDRDKDVPDNNFCTCSNQYEGRPVCDILQKLNQEQVKFCARYMSMKAADLARVLSDKNQLSLSWTHEQIEVRESTRLRSADAVTNAKNMSMTLNQKRFLEMDESERVFLVGHELFHLTSYQGKTLTDEGDIGPFHGPDGGRQFINAMAAALVIESNEYGVAREYQAAEKRSKSYKKTYLSVGYGSMSVPNDTTTAFDIDSTSGMQLSVRHQLTPEFGLIGQLSSFNGKKTILTSIKAEESKMLLGVGAAYRWFPFSNPLTFSGQSHFVFSGTVDYFKGTYKFDEQGVGGEAKSSSTGFTVGCNYFMPYQSNIWGYIGASYTVLNYGYNLDNQVDLKYKDNGTTFAFGVSYGF